ncbi:MAG: hypothetical protein MJ197_09295 [Bacteroidales bacterium]|nr:hypothetical protein [Bacteroidales bacterium]
MKSLNFNLKCRTIFLMVWAVIFSPVSGFSNVENGKDVSGVYDITVSVAGSGDQVVAYNDTYKRFEVTGSGWNQSGTFTVSVAGQTISSTSVESAIEWSNWGHNHSLGLTVSGGKASATIDGCLKSTIYIYFLYKSDGTLVYSSQKIIPKDARLDEAPVATVTNDVICPNLPKPRLTVSISSDKYNALDGYPTYQWYRGTNLISSARSSAYETSAPGSYTCVFCVSDSLCKTSNPVVVSDLGTPTVSIDKSSLSFSSYVGGDGPASQTLTATVSGVCDDALATASFIDGEDNFTLTDNGDGTFSIKPKYSTATAGTYTGNLKFVVDGGLPVSVSLQGTVYEPLSVEVGNCAPIGSTSSSYTVTTTGGAEPLTYQWYNNSGAIAGATATSYSGSQTSLYCKVTDAKGTVVTSSTLYSAAVSVSGQTNCTKVSDPVKCGSGYVYEGINAAYNSGSFKVKWPDGTTTGTQYPTAGSQSVHYWTVMDPKTKTITHLTTAPDCEVKVVAPKLIPSQKAFCTPTDVITLDASTTAANNIINNAASCYPQYVFKRDGVVVQSGTSTTLDVTSAESGTYTCEIYASSTVHATTEAITLSSPNPNITVNNSTVTFESQIGETIAPKSVTVEVTGTCDDNIQFTKTGDFTVTKTGDNTFTITPTYSAYETTVEPNHGTVTFTAAGASSVSVDLKGYVYPCSSAELDYFNFEDGNLPAPITTSLFKRTDANGNEGYAVTSTNMINGGQSFSGNTGKVLQIGGNSSPFTAFTVSTVGYQGQGFSVTMTCGNNSGATSKIKVGEESWTIENGTSQQISFFVPKESSKEVVVENSNWSKSTFFDNVTITKVCPPTVSVDISAGSACDGTGTFIATASGSAPFEYEWSVNGVVARERSTDATYSPATPFPDGTEVRVKVFDTYQMIGQSEVYTVQCLSVVPKFSESSSSLSSVCLGKENHLRISDVDKANIAAAGLPMPITYQWYFNGSPKGAATTSYQNLDFASVAAADDGVYTLYIIDADGKRFASSSATLTVVMPELNVDKTAMELSTANSYSDNVVVTPTDAACYQTASTELTGGDAAKFEVSNTDDTYTVSLTTANQDIAGVYESTLTLYDRVKSETKKDVTVSAIVPLLLNAITSDRPCVASVGFTTEIPATKTAATYTWKVNGTAQKSSSVAASTTATSIVFNPSSNLTVGDVVSIEVTTADGLSETQSFTITSCGPSMVITLPAGLAESQNYTVCPGQVFPIDFTLAFSGGAAETSPYTYTVSRDGVELYKSAELTDAGGAKSVANTFPTEAGTYTYEIKADFTSGGNDYTNSISYTITVLDAAALQIDDVTDCSSKNIVFSENSGASNVYWGTTEGTYTNGPVEGTISIGENFGVGATESGTPYYFAVKSDLGTDYCKQETVNAYVISGTAISVLGEQYINEKNICPGNVVKWLVDEQPSVKIGDCEGYTATDIDYQWYVNTSRSYEGADPLIGQTSKELDASAIKKDESGNYYYFCKITTRSVPTYSVNSSFSKITVKEAPASVYIADTAVYNGQKFIVPLDNVEISENGTSWQPCSKDQTIIVYGASEVKTFYVRTKPAGSECYSVPTEFHVWAGQGGVGYIAASTDFENQTKCMNETADTWEVQGASPWGLNNLTYRWYRSTTDGKTTGGTLVSSEKTFTPPTNVAGTFYYYCVIGYTGQTSTYALGTRSITIPGFNDFIIKDAAVCADNQSIDFEYDNDTYAIVYGLDKNNLDHSRAESSTAPMNIGNSGTAPFAVGTTTPVYFSITDENGCKVNTTANAVVYENTVSITNEDGMQDFEVCQSATMPELSIETILCGIAGSVTYQWYKSDSESGTGVAISGATSSTYTPDKDSDVGDNWYYCVASSGAKTATSKKVKGIIHATPDTELTTSIALNASDELEMYCTGSVSFTAKKGFIGYTWLFENTDGAGNVESSKSNVTVVNGMTYSPSCDDETQPDQFRLMVTDIYGCPAEKVVKLNIHKLGKTYYYCGPTGAEYRGQDLSSPWGLNDLSNWHLNSNCTGENPTSFTADACKFVVDKPGVELKEGQVWNVGGHGTRVEVGSGKWSKMTNSVAGADASNRCYPEYCGSCEFFSTIGSNVVDEKFGTIGRADFRADASGLKISGTMNCWDGSEIDIKGGGALEIATNQGSPKIGTCAEDVQYKYEPERSISYNVLVVPGSSVTYSGTGVEKIQAATYSQLYINQSVSSSNVVFPDGTVEIKQALKYDTPIDNTKITVPEGSLVEYTGKLEQEIAPMAYSNLILENASKKYMIGDVTVKSQMAVGPSTTLVGGDKAHVLTLEKGGEAENMPLIYKGAKFFPGNLTVEYTSSDKTEVAAINYYNLALSDVTINKTEKSDGTATINSITKNSIGGARVFPPVDNGGKAIGIAGTIISYPAQNTTVTGSEVVFNGTTHQEIPEFTFNKLRINNTSIASNTTSSMDNKNSVSIAGNVVVQSQLIMEQGIVNTSDYLVSTSNPTPKYSLTVTNTDPNAITTGHFNSTKDASFIVGPVTKNVSAGSNTQTTEIPVGNFSNWYMPLSMSSISKNGTVTVSAETGTTGSNLAEPLESIDHDKYWHVTGTYGKASFSVESRYDLQGSNCIAVASGLNDTYKTLNGTTDGKGIKNSNVEMMNEMADAYLALGKQVITYKKYYYDCSGGKDITDISSWHTGRNGTGTDAISFSEDYATWIIECNATIATKPLEITGSDVVVELGTGAKLTAYNTFKASAMKQGQSSQLYVGKKTECTIYGSHEIADKAVINNYGVLNTYSKTLAVNNGATVTNFAGAQWNMYNVSLKLAATSQSTNENVGHIINYGAVNMTNSSLSVEGRFTQLKNATGAIWMIDNTMSANNKSVVFDKAEFRTTSNDYQYVSLDCGSTFYVKHSDLTFYYGGMEDDNAYINGDLIVEDGNMLVRRQSQGGGKYNITGEGCGNIYLMDTDKSGDGLLTIQGSGGSEFNVNGTVYAMGVVTEGGSGDKINVNEGGFMFIGNMGATLPQYSWVFTVDVKNGGTLNYCGNRTALGDNIGTNSGTLNYAESFYGAGLDNPVNQGDFTSTGKIHALYEDNDACMADYNARAKAEISELLPVEFTMLYGVCKDELVELHWQTASETNNEYFTILRSFDGIAFEEIDYVWGAGTTTAIHNYVFYDTDDKEGGIVYYKLRQTDYDGNVTETKVIAVQTCGKNAQFWVKKDEVEVMFNNPESSNHVVITTLTGKIVYSKTFKDVESARIALPQANGIYIITVIDRRQITSEKIVRY